MNPLKHQQLVLPLRTGYDTGPLAHALFSYAEVISWIRALMPQLLDEADKNGSILDQIHAYLFSDTQLADSVLEQALSEELYGCLYGLKSILMSFDHNWTAAMNCLHEHRKLPPTANNLPA